MSRSTAMSTRMIASTSRLGSTVALPRPLIASSSSSRSASYSTENTGADEFRALLSRNGTTQSTTPGAGGSAPLSANASPVGTERRRYFSPRAIVPPIQLSKGQLFRARTPRPKSPLLGPTNHVARREDPFHLTGTDPVDHAMNPHFVNAFLNPLGRIKTRQETGLTTSTQKRVAKMVKLARALGVVPKLVSGQSKKGLGWSSSGY